MILEKFTYNWAREQKIMENVQKIIRVRMNISKMSDMKIIQDLKKLERIEKRFESML